MALFHIPRAGRQTKDYMERLIRNMFNDSRQIWKQGYGVCSDNAGMVIHSFYSVRNTYQKINPIKVHYFELFIEYEIGREAALMTADIMGRHLYTKGFQSLVSVIDTGDRYMIAFAVNAVSFNGSGLFHDNNQSYLEIYEYLCENTPLKWRLAATENAFFVPPKKEGNYVHGTYA